VKRTVAARGAPGPDGIPPPELLERIGAAVRDLAARQTRLVERALLPALAEEGIAIVHPDAWTEDDARMLAGRFDEQVVPLLTPLAVAPAQPLPRLTSGTTYLLFRVRRSADGGAPDRWGGNTEKILVQIPPGLPRFIPLPPDKRTARYALLDDAVVRFVPRILVGYDIEEACAFRVTRDADVSVDEDEGEDFLNTLEREVRNRRWGHPVRLELVTGTPPEMRDYLKTQFELTDTDVHESSPFLDFRAFAGLADRIGRPELLNPPWPPQPHPALAEAEDPFEVLRERDVLIHVPYHRFDPVVELVQRAASDPAVLGIKMTLYRVSGSSPIVRALIQAAQNGKQVTVLVELRARFDEEANIGWARQLDAAGAHVIYGVAGYKTHAKALLIIRKELDGVRRYAYLGTGNFNDRTARVYTDLGYLTARPGFGADLSAFFNVITGFALPPAWNRIEMAPTGLRRRLVALIDREIERHTLETPGLIRAKMNALIDPRLIRALYDASRAGVRIDLVVRGVCRLRPGVRGLSETIRVTSIVDRFLEHARIFHFRNGGSDEVYASSADWMERNMEDRLELMFPLVDATARRQALRVLDVALEDNVKAWTLRPDGTYVRARRRSGAPRRRSQEILHREARTSADRGGSAKRRTFRPIRKPT
jgi:polyphosphate kinase